MTGAHFPMHEYYMRLALREAQRAGEHGDVPVGAVIVLDGEVIGAAGNERELRQSPLAHAELLAIGQAAERMGSWRLLNTVLYVTMEPCPMCAGAIILARIPEVYFGASDPKAGVCGTLMNLLEDQRFNHQPAVHPGVLGEECGAMLTNFFREIRRKGRNGATHE